MLHIEPIQPLLAGLMLKPGLIEAAQQEKGIALADIPLKARAFINQGGMYNAVRQFSPSETVSKVPVTYLRLTSTDNAQTKRRLHQLQLLGEDGKVVVDYSFFSHPWPATR